MSRWLRPAGPVGAGLLGVVVGSASLWTHHRWWSFALAVAATMAAEVALPRGMLRFLYAVGWLLGSGVFLFARREGDFAVGSDPAGYAFLLVGLIVLMLAVVTIPPRSRVSERAGPST